LGIVVEVKSAYDLVKIENQGHEQGHEQSHKLDGIRVGRIRMFPFLLLPFVNEAITYDPVKTRLLELEAEVEEPINLKARNQTL